MADPTPYALLAAYRAAPPLVLNAPGVSINPPLRAHGLISQTFTVLGHGHYKRVSWCGKPFELYRLDRDGRERFIGYERDYIRETTERQFFSIPKYGPIELRA